MSDPLADLPPLPQPLAVPGGFAVAAVGLDHGHIFGMCDGLVRAGATVTWVLDRDAAAIARLQAAQPTARTARDLDEILADPAVRLVAIAAVPGERAGLAIRAMQAGKDVLVDKAPLIDAAQLAAVRATIAATGRRWAVYYGERVDNEAAQLALHLVRRGAVGRVLQIIGFSPHRLDAARRPDWFWRRADTGGILIDIGAHQADQFLSFTGAADAEVVAAQVANRTIPAQPEFEDVGSMLLRAPDGATGFHRVDWLTPDGRRTWGDGRIFVLGSTGSIEVRQHPGVGGGEPPCVLLCDRAGEHHLDPRGRIGRPFFAALLRDCLERSETAMCTAHALAAIGICLRAQALARTLPPPAQPLPPLR